MIKVRIWTFFSVLIHLYLYDSIFSKISLSFSLEFDKNDNIDSSITHNRNAHRRSRRRRTRFPSENSTSVESGSVGNHNLTVYETSMPESRDTPTKVTECYLHGK